MSTSSSTKATRLAEYLQQAVYELSTIAPAFPPRTRFTVEQHHAYGVGWYAAVLRAMAVLRAAEDRFELNERTKRQTQREKRSA